ncbi:MAG TPA: hypothetical protein V6D20_19080 [Candidatus Obscuribacterales bacterium]
MSGHLVGQARGETTKLFVDVEEEGGGLPTTLFLDGGSIDTIEVHGHGASGPERVAADIGDCVAELGREETQTVHATFDGSIDVTVVDVARLAKTCVVSGDGSVDSAPIRSDVV